MDFYVVYRVGEDGGQVGCVYFRNPEAAQECAEKWRITEPYHTICTSEESTED